MIRSQDADGKRHSYKISVQENIKASILSVKSKNNDYGVLSLTCDPLDSPWPLMLCTQYIEYKY